MDPLKPFSSSIRTLWERSTKRAAASEHATSTNAAGIPQPATPAAAAPPSQALHARLRTRLVGLQKWDTTRARELFVESVVISELGEALSTDPGFGSLVHRVSQQLGADGALSSRLDRLLQMTRDGTLQT